MSRGLGKLQREILEDAERGQAVYFTDHFYTGGGAVASSLRYHGPGWVTMRSAGACVNDRQVLCGCRYEGGHRRIAKEIDELPPASE